MRIARHWLVFSALSVVSLIFQAPRCHAGQEPERAPAAGTGSFAIAPLFESAGAFSDGLAAVQTGDDEYGKWGYIDKTGKFAIEPEYDAAEAFSEGLAAVRVGDEKTGKWGYIDKTGKIVINPQFDSAWNFSEGLASVTIGNKDGFIDKTGRWLLDPTCSAQ